MVLVKQSLSMLLGAVIAFALFTLISITFIFSDFFLEFSGVFTFYSLLAVFVIFLIAKIIEKSEDRADERALLRTVDRSLSLVKEDIETFGQSLIRGAPPLRNLFYMEDDFQVLLPEKIQNRTTFGLKRRIYRINKGIDALNSIRDKLWDLVWEKGEKQRENFYNGELFEEIQAHVQNELAELRKDVSLFENELKSWKTD